jgi:type IV secretory pathway TrbF-like protein
LIAKNRNSKKRQKKMGDKSPYLAARREWEERYGCFVSAAHSWKITATLSLIIALVATAGAIYLASQKKVTAYIVEIDKFGSIVQVQQSGTSDKATTKKVIIAQLAGFVKKFRDVSLDAQLQRQNVFDAYVFLQRNTPAFTKVTEFFKKNDPFERAKKETVFAEIISVLPLKDNAFQVEWRETIMDRQSGQTLSTSNYKLVAYTSMSPPTDEGNILKNPTGLIVNDLNWSKEI